MANSKFDLEAHQEWKIECSAGTGPKSFPTINLYAVGPELGSMPFHISMSIEQAKFMIDKLIMTCEMLEISQDQIESSKH